MLLSFNRQTLLTLMKDCLISVFFKEWNKGNSVRQIHPQDNFFPILFYISSLVEQVSADTRESDCSYIPSCYVSVAVVGTGSHLAVLTGPHSLDQAGLMKDMLYHA